MSKNHNYRQYSQPVGGTTPEDVKEDKKEIVESETVEEVKEENIESELPAPAEKVQLIGVVTNCTRLNIRKLSNPYSEVISKVEAGSELKINPDESTEAFYKVCTEAGLEGFCMKEFVTVKS